MNLSVTPISARLAGGWVSVSPPASPRPRAASPAAPPDSVALSFASSWEPSNPSASAPEQAVAATGDGVWMPTEGQMSGLRYQAMINAIRHLVGGVDAQTS